MNDRNRVTARYYVRGTMELLEPMIVGSGENEKADMEFVRDGDGNFFIPGTTFAGVIRHELEKRLGKGARIEASFGSQLEESGHSLFYFYDAFFENETESVVRDGIRVDPNKGTVLEKSKYDFEVVSSGSRLRFRMEAIARERTDGDEVASMLETIVALLESGTIALGAKSRRGYGRVRLSDTERLRIDLKTQEGKTEWIDFDWESEWKSAERFASSYPMPGKACAVRSLFELPASMIIRSYGVEPDDPDSSMLQEHGVSVIPGTSWNGALRGALYRIGVELGKRSRMEKLVEELFGFVDERRKSSRASRLRVFESRVSGGGLRRYIRTRIDRVSGGVAETALFDEKPQYGGGVELTCEIDGARDYEIGMIILAIKELQNGLQTIGGGGNIGRGRLRGKRCEVEREERKGEQEYLNALAVKLQESEDVGRK